MKYILSQKEYKSVILALKNSNEICNSVMNMDDAAYALRKAATESYNFNNVVFDILNGEE